MAPLWPFKKKEPVAELDEEPPAPVVYKRGEDPHTRSSVSTDAAAYQDALALFGGGSHEVEAATDLAAGYDGVTEDTTVSSAVKRTESSATDDTVTWVHHTDGYHYKQHPDGTFEPTPHVLNNDGTYTPYS